MKIPSNTRPLLSQRIARHFVVGALAVWPFALPAFQQSGKPELPNFDKRMAAARAPAGEVVEGQQRAALAQLKARVPESRIERDEILGTPRLVTTARGFLTGPDGQGKGVSAETARALPANDPHRAVKGFLNEHAALFGHDANVLNSAKITRDFTTPHNGLRTVVWQQELDGLTVFEGLFTGHTTKKGELVSLSSRFVPDAARAADRGLRNQAQANPKISAAQAIVKAAENLGEKLSLEQVRSKGAPANQADQLQHFTAAPALNGDAHARLLWLPMDRATMRLCWEVLVTSRARGEMFRVLIEAGSGEALVRHSLTTYISNASYRVFTSDSPTPFSPGHPTPSSAPPPLVPRTLVVTNAVSTNASPNGWINDGDNETRGNNADAHLDANNDNEPDLPRPQGSPARVFDFAMNLNQAPATYTRAAVVQLFYWNNWMHDQLYELGFTEAAGNFQVDNFGRGGRGDDAVEADAQDGGGFNNANFSTPPDGFAPRMQMYLFDGPTPDRDGDFDAEIVLHEYTHGLSNRRVGGGVGISALQSSGMGEGWSDFYGLALLSEAGDDLDGNYAAGAYSTLNFLGLRENYYFGIRRYPYSTDLRRNPLTFKDIDPAQADPHTGVRISPVIGGGGAAEVHNQGEVWCVTLWEARAGLIRKHGFEAGNRLILQLVTDGMNLSPPNPNFVEARDAILQADLVNTGGANTRELWAAFARRGLGDSASSPPSSTTSGLVEAFDVPDDLLISPRSGVSATGPAGGPFAPAAQSYSLTNSGTNTVVWTATATGGWLDLSPSAGVLAPGAPDVTLQVSFNQAARFLTAGLHRDPILIANLTSEAVQTRPVTLSVGQPDSFTELIEDARSQLGFQTLTFSPDGSTNFYAVCREPADHFPTDPRTAKFVPLRDDDFEAITLAGSARVSLFGRRTNLFYIGSNGYLTFSSGDDTREPSLSAHFSRPRVAGLFADLNPSFFNGNGQGVYWQQLSDRAVVTWQNVPAYFTTNANNFQIELFYDGRIRLTYLHVSAAPAIAGLSRGQGVPAGFVESDLSGYGPCGPQLEVSLPRSAAEGDGTLVNQGQVSVAVAPVADLIVSLNSSDTSEARVPASIVVPAGQTHAAFNVIIAEDLEQDGTQVAMVTAAAAGYLSGSAAMFVRDNETDVLTVGLPASVSEGAGTVRGTVSLSAPATSDVVVQLTSNHPADLQAPELVLILAGSRTGAFVATLTDNGRIEPGRSVVVTAHVDHWTDGSATVEILDDEPRTLTVKLPAQASETAGTLVRAGSVGIVAPLPTNLVVALFSSDSSEVTVPATTSIVAGQTNGTFDLTMTDDAVLDGTRMITITARAAGWTNGSAILASLDDETPSVPGVPGPPHLSSNNSVRVNLSWNFSAPGGELVVNGGFESGDLTGWTAKDSGNGEFLINDGNVDPYGPDGPMPPYDGSFSALSQQAGGGRHEIWQDIALPANVTSATLRWADKLRNHAGEFTESQKFSVEVRDTNDAVLAVAFATKPGDVPLADWVERDYDLSAYRGQTIRLAFVESDGLYYFNAHLDEVSVRVAEPVVTTYEVFFGTNPTPGPAHFLGATTNTVWELPDLAPQTTYYWRVVARRLGEASGPVWQFTTRGLDHFTWSALAPTQHVGVPFAATVTARDELNRTMSNFTGTARFSMAPVVEEGSFTMLESPGSPETANNGAFTIGYSFTPSNDLQVTHVRHFSGSRVSIWTDDGTLLVAQEVQSVGGSWQDTPLPAPVKLTAGNRYRVGFLTGGTPYFWRFDLPATFAHGTIHQGYETPGDAFPTTTDSVTWFFVDLRYRLELPPTYVMAPVASGNFVNGSWTGQFTASSLATNVRLRARDDTGHSGLTEPFSVGPGPGTLDHFEWSTVASPQFILQPFAVTLTAKDILNSTLSNYHGAVAIGGQTEAPSLTVGDGAEPSVFPLATFFEDARSQLIYLSSELAGPQRFTGLALNIVALPGQTMKRWTVRMKHTPLSRYEIFYPSLETNDWTTVYQRDETIASTGWVKFLFSTPFDYDGTRNLMIDFSFNNDSYSFDGEVNSTLTEEPRAIHYYTDGDRGDPLLWSGSYPQPLADFAVPNLRLFTPAPTITITPPSAGPFVDGAWTGSITVADLVESLRLFADDGNGHTATSNPFPVGARNDVSVTITDNPDPLAVGERLTYSITASNAGPLTATNVVLNSFLPASVSLVSTSATQGTILRLGTTVRFNLGPLSAGASARGFIVVTPNSAGELATSVNVTHDGPEGYPPNDSVTARTTAGLRTLFIDNSSVTEGDAGTTNVLFHIRLSIASTQTLAVSFSTRSDTAFAGSDYVPTNGTVVFAPGQTNKTIAIRVIGDRLSEFQESFYVDIAGPPGLLVTTRQGQATISDDDPYPLISIRDVSVVEGNTGETNAVFQVSLSAPSGRSVSMNYGTADGTATTEMDYLPVTGTLTFNPGQTNRTLSVTVLGDTLGESNETFSVKLSNSAGGFFDRDQAVGTILTDDVGPVMAAGSALLTGDPNRNHVIDPGEQVTVDFPLKNIGTAPATNLVATLQVAGGVTAPSGPQTYGALAPGSGAATRPFTFTASGANGSTLMARLHVQEGPLDLGTVTFEFVLGPRSEFRIVSLTTNGCAIVEHEAVTGNDRGGLAASASQVFCTGDDSTARFRLDDLSGGTALGVKYDALAGNLRTERVYSLGNGNIPLGNGGGTVTTLLEIDGDTGIVTGNRVNLSVPIMVSFGAGIFSGYDRVVLHTGSRVYEIAFPSGLVRDLGAMSSLTHSSCESWAFWGVAEHAGTALSLVYVRDFQTIVRTRVPDGLTTPVATFENLGDMCSFTVSRSLRRWYFHYQYYSQFGSGRELIGFCDASFASGTIPELDQFEWSAIPKARLMGQAIPLSLTARDQFHDVFTNFTGTVALGATAAGGMDSRTLLNSPTPVYTNRAQLTFGYAFTPRTNITVTHVRHISGTKVSIWTDAGGLLASVPVNSSSGTWLETPLSSPVQLRAGTRYRVGAYAGGSGDYYYSYELPPIFNDGTIDQSYDAFGDAFPNFRTSVRWWYVDLRYTVETGRPVPITPAFSGNFVRGIWAGSVTVQEPGSNVVLSADDRAGHRARSNPFRVLASSSGGLDHFEWGVIASTQTVDAPFAVTVRAKTDLEETFSGFNGTVSLTANGLAPGSFAIRGSVPHEELFNSGDYTLGYAFTPTNDVVVTHVRHYSGSKVSIWDDTGSLLASVPVNGVPGLWSETPLTTPLPLPAGNQYRVGFRSGGVPYYWRSEVDIGFTNGLVGGSFYAAGDEFPDSPFPTGWWLVDLRYEAIGLTPLPVSPAASANFSGGIWSGAVAVRRGAAGVILRAEDASGHTGESNPFGVLAVPSPLLSMARSGNRVIISWPTDAPGYALETAGAISVPMSWIPATDTPVIVGNRNTVTNTLTGSKQFYRLSKPPAAPAAP